MCYQEADIISSVTYAIALGIRCVAAYRVVVDHHTIPISCVISYITNSCQEEVHATRSPGLRITVSCPRSDYLSVLMEISKGRKKRKGFAIYHIRSAFTFAFYS